MTKYRVTLIIQSDEDPSGIMDDFEHQIEEYMDTCELDPDAVEDGEAVTVEEVE